MSKNVPDVIWEKPEGEHVLLNSKSDLIDFLNKTGLIDDCESAEQRFHIKIKTRQMTQEELDDNGMEYDPEYESDTEIYLAESYKPKYIAPIFGYNMFIEKDDASLYPFPKYSTNICYLDEDNVELNEDVYKFPCVVFAHFEKSFDRGGAVEFACWYVTPLNTMHTPESLNRELSDNYKNWDQNRINKEIFEKEREEYRKSKETQ